MTELEDQNHSFFIHAVRVCGEAEPSSESVCDQFVNPFPVQFVFFAGSFRTGSTQTRTPPHLEAEEVRFWASWRPKLTDWSLAGCQQLRQPA